MGARLVGLAYAYAADVPLNPNEFRLLGWMSLTAMDQDETPRYFDSREAAALGIGRKVADRPKNEKEQAERAAAFQAVKDAISGLVKLEAIERTKVGGNGRRAEFAIVLNVARTRLTDEFTARSSSRRNLPPRRRRSPSGGRSTLPLRGRPDLPVGVGPTYQLEKVGPTPQEKQEEPGTTRGHTSPEPTTSPVPVDKTALGIRSSTDKWAS